MTATTITPTGLESVFRSLLISDDTAYREQIKGAKQEVEQAVVEVNVSNRDFAIALLTKCIQRETGISDSALPKIKEDLNAFVDGIVRANISQSQIEKKDRTIERIVDELRTATERTYKQGLDHIKKNDELLALIVELKVQSLLGAPDFDNPFATADDLREAVIAKINNG